MTASVNSALEVLENSLTELEAKVARRVERSSRSQAELFGISEEEKTLNKNIASKLDSTIQRLETLLQEE